MDGSSNCLAVPAEMLAVMAPGAESEAAPVVPAVGDPVEVQVGGIVESVDGGTVRVRVATVNGAPLPQPEPDLATAAQAVDGEAAMGSEAYDSEPMMREMAAKLDEGWADR